MIVGEREIQVILAMLISVGALLLSFAQGTPAIFVLSIVVVVGTLILIDIKKAISVHPIVVNILAFAVSILTINQFSGGDASSKLNAVANLLTYLQLVLLLQKKNARLYWQVMMLSLLQVVVAAALHLDFNAGVAFIAHMILTVVAMVHLNRYRQSRNQSDAADAAEKRIARIRNGNHSQPIVMVFRGPSAYRRKSFVWHSLLLACVGLVFAMIVFFSIPRFDSAWYGTKNSPAQITGFSPVVRFGDEGFLKESNNPVMRVSFLDEENQPIRLAIEPYFRGLTLEHYSKVDGEWLWQSDDLRIRGYTDGGDRLASKNDKLSADVKWMRQVVKLERVAHFKPNQESQSHILFSVYPLFQNSNSPIDLIFDRRSRIFFRDAVVTKQSLNGPYKFETKTPMYRNLGQLPATPYERNEAERYNSSIFSGNLLGTYYREFDFDWGPIREFATEVVESVVDKKDRRLICEAMVSRLKKEDFKYSLALDTIDRNPAADPVIDFLLNHKTGHCEYFATGLALMLRSQGIECRLVSGFRGGDYNEIGGFYDVKEKHAHTWVEARMRPIDCKKSDMIATGQANQDGAWLRLDATPSSDFENTAYSGRNILDQAGDAIGFMEKLWDDYVMGLDGNSRKSNGFDPTNESKSWFNGDGIRTQIESLVSSIRSFHWSVYAIVLVVGLSIPLMIGLLRVKKTLRENSVKLSPMEMLYQVALESFRTIISPQAFFQRSSIAASSQVDFYDQFEKIVKKHLLERNENQTQREFGQAIVATISEDVSESFRSDLQQKIQFIIDAYYCVRFFDETLGLERNREIAAKLLELESLLNSIGQEKRTNNEA